MLLSIVAASGVLVVAAALFSRTAVFRRFATSLLADTVRKHTGRELTLAEPPTLRLGLAPSLVARGIDLSAAAGSSRAETVRARQIEVRVRLLPLLHRRIVVERLAITGLQIAMDIGGKPPGAKTPGAVAPTTRSSPTKGLASLLSRLDVGEVLIADSCLVLHDCASGKQTRIGVDRLRLAKDGLAPEQLDADAAGSLGGVPISLSGTLGGPAALLSDTESFPVNVVVRTDGATVAVEGRIGKVLAFDEVDVGVRAEVTDPAALGRVLGARLAGNGPWRLEGRVRDAGAGYTVDELAVVLGGSGLKGSLQVGGATGASLTLAGGGIALAPLLAALGVRGGPNGRVAEFGAELRTSGGTPRELVVNLAGRVHVGHGRIDVGRGTWIEVERADVVSGVGGLSVEAVGSLGGVPLTVAGTVGSVEALAFGRSPYPVKGVVGTPGATIGVEGRLGGPLTSLTVSGGEIELAPLLAFLGAKGDVQVSLGGLVADLQTRGVTPRAWVSNLTGQAYVTQGSVLIGGGAPIHVTRASLATQSAGELGVEAVVSVGEVPLSVSGAVGGIGTLAFGGTPFPVKVAVGTNGGAAAIDGTIGSVWAFRAVDLRVRAEVTDPPALGRALGASVPGGGSWLVDGRLRDEGAGYELDPVHVAVGGNGLTGTVRLGGAEPASLKLSGRGIELAPLLAALGVKGCLNGNVAELDADVRTTGGVPRDWVSNLAGQVRVGHGRAVIEGGPRIEVERADVASATGGLAVSAVGSVGGVPLVVSGTVGDVETLAFGGNPLPVRAVVATDGGTAAINGVIERVWALGGFDFGVQAEVTNAATLGCALAVELPTSGPWRVEGRVRETGAGYAFDPLAVAFAGNSVTGRVRFDRSGVRPAVALELSAAALDLSAPGEGTGAPEDETPTPAKGGPVFSNAPLPLHALTAADGRASLAFADVALHRHAVAGSLAVGAQLANGSLVADPIELHTAGGTLTGGVRVDASGSVSAKLVGEDIELGALVSMAGGTTKATGGTTRVKVDLQSTGRSLHEWMANLRGEVRTVTGPGRLEGTKIDLGLGLLSRVVDLINPFRTEDKHTDLRCVVVNARIANGVVDFADRFVLEAEKFTAIGSGTIDLGREVLDMDLYARSSLSVSAGLSNFSGIVKVKGPLRKPSFSLNAKGATTTALSVGGAVATAGLSLVGEELLTKMTAKAHCRDALAASVPAPGDAGAPKTP